VMKLKPVRELRLNIVTSLPTSVGGS
jgi:hypothetical protein